MKTARFVLSRDSVGTSLLEIARLVCMDVGFFICRFFLMRFHFDRHFAASAVALFLSSSIASREMSASGAPANVAAAFPPLPTHLFTAFNSGSLSHKYSTSFFTEVPRNAKTKAASSRLFELDPSFHLPLLPFLFPRRFT